jgi:hypothetical protein
LHTRLFASRRSGLQLLEVLCLALVDVIWPGELKCIGSAPFRYPISDHRGTMGGRIKNRVSARAPVTPRPAVPAKGNPPSMLAGAPTSAEGAAFRLVPDSAAAPGLIAAAPVVQLGGTDKAPTKFARPIPAVAAALVPRPGAPADASTFVGEPSPPSTGASAVPASLARLALGTRLCSWFAFDRRALAIQPVELVIDMTVLIELSDADDPDDAGEASPCSVCGTANIACDSIA